MDPASGMLPMHWNPRIPAFEILCADRKRIRLIRAISVGRLAGAGTGTLGTLLEVGASAAGDFEPCSLGMVFSTQCNIAVIGLSNNHCRTQPPADVKGQLEENHTKFVKFLLFSNEIPSIAMITLSFGTQRLSRQSNSVHTPRSSPDWLSRLIRSAPGFV